VGGGADGAKLLLLFVLLALIGWLPGPVLLTIGRCGCCDSLSLVCPLFWFPILAKITNQRCIMEVETNTGDLAYQIVIQVLSTSLTPTTTTTKKRRVENGPLF
jgi:hypothetical protein